MSAPTADELEKRFEGVEARFLESKERDKIKNMLINKLKTEGWAEKMKQLTRDKIKSQGLDNVSAEYLFDELKIEGRKSVSNAAKTEVYEMVKKWIQQETGVEV